MTTFLQFAVLGLGTGAVYAVLALGLVVQHRASGVLNFSISASAMLGAFIYWSLAQNHGVGQWLAAGIAVAVVGLLSPVAYLVAIAPLKNASTLARVVATLGFLLMLVGGCQIAWGNDVGIVNSLFPRESFSIGEVVVPTDRLWMMGFVVVVAIALWATDRFTRVGLATRAAASNSRGAAALGWSPAALAAFGWMIGGVLSAIAGILTAPLVGLEVTTFPLLIINVLAVALIGGFRSYPLTILGAAVVGIAQAELAYYVDVTGIVWSLPFFIVVVLIAVRGKGLPDRGFFTERPPEVGSGRVDFRIALMAVVLLAVLIFTAFPDDLLDALTISLAWATIMLGVVVLLGFTGQLSFEQMGMAGLAALVAARLVQAWDFPFEIAFLCGLLAAVPIGVIFALPALRTRGVNLAVVTLGLGSAIFFMVFSNSTLIGGFDGTPVGTQSLFGIPIDSQRHADRYALLVVLAFTLCAFAVGNVRRGRAGSALLAIRTNERAAAALGIRIFNAKLFAFAFGAALAAFGGILLSFRQTTIAFLDFDPFTTILLVAFLIIGGVGYVSGTLAGAMFATGGVGTWLVAQFWTNPDTKWLSLVGGVSIVLMVNLHPDGAASVMGGRFRALGRLLRISRDTGPKPPEPLPDVERGRAQPRRLDVENLTVRFGGVVAVNDVSLRVEPGEIVGLIGPNGAGKTTVIDAITGFVSPATGRIVLEGTGLEAWPVHRRNTAGVSRSFQSLELFEQSTVRENLRVASDRRDLAAYASDIVYPRHSPISAAAVAAVREFELEAELDLRVTDLPYGHRRLVAVARAIATDPSILLLDEPAAGLSRHETAELGHVVRRLAERWGIGILVVEHDMTFVMQVCDRIVVLDHGSMIAVGTPKEIQRDPAVIAAYLGSADADEPAAPAARPAVPS